MHTFTKRLYGGAVCLFLLIVLWTYAETRPPRMFPRDVTVTISKGMTLSEAADLLTQNQIIKSPFLFKVSVTLIGKDTGSLKSGQYFLHEPAPVYTIASRLVNGLGGFPIVKITIPEGVSSMGIADIITKQIPKFNAQEFKLAARPYEGFLFPETYFWPSNIEPAQVISIMQQQFKEQTGTTSVARILASSTRTLDDIVKMAAILEREASSTEDRRLIAGVLWKRLDIGMALQVDAPFEYFLNKPSSELTREDLATKNPYNLYLNRGLGPTAIVNPGISSIIDAATPTPSKYWYYLSDKQGVLHYAVTLEGHAANKNKYLR